MRLGDYIAQRNSEAISDFIVKGTLGVLFSILVFGSVYFFTLFFVTYQYAHYIALIFILVSFASVILQENPMLGLEPLSDRESASRAIERRVAFVTGGGSALGFRRDSIAAYATILIEGPRLLVQSWRARKRRIDIDENTIIEAEKAIAQAAQNSNVSADPRAIYLIVMLDLATVLPTRDKSKFSVQLTPLGKRMVS